jgi:hypothetical protein
MVQLLAFMARLTNPVRVDVFPVSPAKDSKTG